LYCATPHFSFLSTSPSALSSPSLHDALPISSGSSDSSGSSGCSGSSGTSGSSGSSGSGSSTPAQDAEASALTLTGPSSAVTRVWVGSSDSPLNRRPVRAVALPVRLKLASPASASSGTEKPTVSPSPIVSTGSPESMSTSSTPSGAFRSISMSGALVSTRNSPTTSPALPEASSGVIRKEGSGSSWDRSSALLTR